MYEQDVYEQDVYEQDDGSEANLQPIDLAPLPADTIAALYDLALRGNMVEIGKQAIELEHLGALYKPFARELRRLARTFQDEQILSLLEQYQDVG